MKKYLILLFAIFTTALSAQNVKVQGVITDAENGDPVLGATVIILGTTIGEITNFEGEYSLSNVPASAVLEFSMVGYQSV